MLFYFSLNDLNLRVKKWFYSELVYDLLGMLCKRFEELDVATILALLQCEKLPLFPEFAILIQFQVYSRVPVGAHLCILHLSFWSL